ncbi:MAG: methanogenesis marker 6 protein [Thermoprotei archaeon]|nr:MAG: methanogenesis marker 6 protein [Thermoprotei archaeon]
MKSTYIIVINPDSELSPEQLFNEVLELNADVAVKCTCFGVMIEGEEEETSKVISHVRRRYPYDVFVKLRGYPINDKRVCRAYRGGGPRPGFHQLEAEFRLLPLISEALKALEGVEVIEVLPAKVEGKPIKAKELEEVVRRVLGG